MCELRDLGSRLCDRASVEGAAGRSNLLALILDAMLSVIGCGTLKMVGVEMPLP